MVQYYTDKNKARITADAIAISHFIVANVIILLGVLFPKNKIFALFLSHHSTTPGVDFVYQVMDRPVYKMFRGTAEGFRGTNDFMFFLSAEAIIILGSFFYGLIAYFLLSLFLKLTR
jgi:hypothetical protein